MCRRDVVEMIDREEVGRRLRAIDRRVAQARERLFEARRNLSEVIYDTAWLRGHFGIMEDEEVQDED